MIAAIKERERDETKAPREGAPRRARSAKFAGRGGQGWFYPRADIAIVFKLMRLSASSAGGGAPEGSRYFIKLSPRCLRSSNRPASPSIFPRLTQRAELMRPLAVKSIGIRARALLHAKVRILCNFPLTPGRPFQFQIDRHFPPAIVLLFRLLIVLRKPRYRVTVLNPHRVSPDTFHARQRRARLQTSFDLAVTVFLRLSLALSFPLLLRVLPFRLPLMLRHRLPAIRN